MKMADKLLRDRVAVVTGSSRGLGRAFAMGLAQEGAKVVVNGTDSKAVQGVVDEIKRQGGTAEACVSSVASMDGARRLIEFAVERFGRMDILVNNAGVVRDRTLLKMSEEEFDVVVATNMKGTFACSKFAATHMREQKSGRIINVTAGAGAFGNFGQTNYAAAKAGILAMTLTWAGELEAHGISVNAVRASANTRMTAPIIEGAKQRAREAGAPEPAPADVGFFEPEAAAPLVVFLASDYAKGISGQLFSIDGPRLSLWGRPRALASAYFPGCWTTQAIAEFFDPTVRPMLDPYCAAAVRAFIGERGHRGK